MGALCSALVLGVIGLSRSARAEAFSKPPSDQELFQVHALEEPLVPLDGHGNPVSNQQVVNVLSSFEARATADDFSALEEFLSSHPESPWRLAVQTNLGLLYHRTGYFTKCLPAFLAAWKSGKDATDPKAKALADRAGGEYAKMLARLGLLDDLKIFLKETEGRVFVGQATELIAAGQRGAALMESKPEVAYRCGALALGRILASQGSPLRSSALIAEAKSTVHGMSLAQVADLSRRLGMNYQAAKRSPGAKLIIPSVIHWKAGHYAALVAEEKDRLHAEDAAFGQEIWHSASALSAEASGYFLVPPGPLPAGWAAVSLKEAETIFGKGFIIINNPDATKECDPKSKSCPCPPCRGMATHAFHTMLGSLNLTDTPAGYQPPYGPEVNVEMTYNQREAGQPSNFNYANFGSKWNWNWLSYIIDDPANPSVASLAASGGGTLRFSGYTTATRSFVPQYETQSTLVRTSATPLRYEQTYPDGSKDVYAMPNGATTAPRKVFLTERIDSAGNGVTLTYDTQLRISKMTDAIGQATTVSYDLPSDPYKITKVTDPFGRHADFTYDGSRRLITIQDVIGIQSQFGYAATGDFISSLTTPYGSTQFASTSNGTELSATDPQGDKEVLQTGEEVSYFWDKKAWSEAPNDVRSAHLYHWQQTPDFSGSDDTLESEIPPLENRISYNYPGQTSDPAATKVRGTISLPSKVGRRLNDGTTELTQYTYNALGRPTSFTDAVGRETLYSYQANNIDLASVSQRQDTLPVILTTYTWNSQHRPLRFTDAAGQLTTYTWNGHGQMTSATNPKSETTTFTYYSTDAAGQQRNGRLYQIDGPLPGNSDLTTYDYDALGRVAAVTGNDGYNLAFTYDALDRPLRVTFPDDTYAETTYFRLDPETQRDRLGRISTFAYNSLGQLKTSTDPANRVFSYAWCTCGGLKQLIDSLGRATRWKHDLAGRVTAKKYAGGTGLSYSYAVDSGRLQSVTDEKGQIKTYAYNPDDTVSGVTYSQTAVPTPSVAFSYDPTFRRISSMSDGTGVTNYAYYPIAPGTPGAGSLSSVDGPLANDTITYAYDELGRRTSRAINGVSESYTFDVLGRLSSLANPLGTFGYTFVAATGRLDHATFPNGLTRAYQYEPLAGDFRVQSITHTLPGNVPVGKHTYLYDAGDRLTTWGIQDGAGPLSAFTAGYDAVDRLTSFATAGQTFGYSYDAADNRLTETINGATSAAGYNALNEIVSLSAPSPAEARTLTWDGENRLVAMDYPSTNQRTELTYDGLHRCVRIVEKTGGSVLKDRRFVWCEYNRCEERDAAGSAVLRRFYGEGEQIGNQSFYYCRDHLGSVRQVTDATTIRARYTYDAWGRRTKIAGDVDATFGFTGHYVSGARGLLLAPLRAYDPELGRWLSRDPIAEKGGLNLFAYANNDPLGQVDPLGNKPICDKKKAKDKFGDWLYDKLFGPTLDEAEKQMAEDYRKLLDKDEVSRDPTLPEDAARMTRSIIEGLGNPKKTAENMAKSVAKNGKQPAAPVQKKVYIHCRVTYNDYRSPSMPSPGDPMTSIHGPIPEPAPWKVEIYNGSEYHEAEFQNGRRTGYR